MKLTSKIILMALTVAIACMIAANLMLKREYDAMDKSDLYWTYEKVLQTPFKHLRIKGGNMTKIAFEQSNTCSVRILQSWVRYHGGTLHPIVKNDTLIIDFDYVGKNPFDKYWVRRITPVRIFSPELLSVTGVNTNFTMLRMKQKSFHVDLAGRTSFEVESLVRDLDSITISEKDSTEVVFEMSPEYKGAAQGRVADVKNDNNSAKPEISENMEIKNKEAMSLKSLVANIQGSSMLDIGHAQISKFKLDISDSSGILLSGGALRKLK